MVKHREFFIFTLKLKRFVLELSLQILQKNI